MKWGRLEKKPVPDGGKEGQGWGTGTIDEELSIEVFSLIGTLDIQPQMWSCVVDTLRSLKEWSRQKTIERDSPMQTWYLVTGLEKTWINIYYQINQSLEKNGVLKRLTRKKRCQDWNQDISKFMFLVYTFPNPLIYQC